MKITNFFSHDSNARNDEKMINLRMVLGAEGYGIYFMILERLREDANYMSVKDYNMLAFDLRVDASKVKKTVEEFGLFVFTDDGEYFYSESFNRRMEIKDEKSKKKSEAGKKGAEARWGNGTNNSTAMNKNGNAMAEPSIKMASKVKESKVKKSKDTETRAREGASFDEPIVQGVCEDFSAFETFWEKFPNKIHKEQSIGYWASINPTPAMVNDIMQGLDRWLQSDQWERGVYQSPVNWLRDERWKDWPPKRKTKKEQVGSHNYQDEDLHDLIAQKMAKQREERT